MSENHSFHPPFECMTTAFDNRLEIKKMIFDSDAEVQGASNGAIHFCSILNFGGEIKMSNFH